MANVFAPFGFLHLGNTDGASPTFGMITRQISSADSNKVFHGDPVKSLSTGFVGAWTAGTAVSQMAGIFVGVRYLSVSQGKYVWSQYWPGSDATANTVEAYLVPCNLSVPGNFLVQSGNSATTATPIAFADIGQTIDVAMGTGSTVTGLSGAYADQNTQGTTATLPFRIMGLYQGGANVAPNGADTTTANNWIIVAANVSGAGSTGI